MIIVGIAQAQNEDSKILWAKNTRINWSDFQGTPPKFSYYEANTNAGISFTWKFENYSKKTKLIYTIENIFYPKLSWVYSTSKSDILLNHEQLHFDISELHARKLRKIISNVDSTKLNKTFLSYSKMIHGQIMKVNREMQNAYDAETNHGLNEEAELRWQLFIKEELSKFEEFSS